ncbi:MAG: GIY-YIG nuclease family protein [Candidatus Staskawiczbacteria bacterium]|nr:GIY-YIG nuclease family protein [Candidatus Staskawiczbacteria bacterium]
MTLRSRNDEGSTKMQYFIYILECADESFYIGCTNDLSKRIKQHNESKCGAHYTKIRRPVKLKYSEIFDNLKDTRMREAEIKGWRREKKIELINKKVGDNK